MREIKYRVWDKVLKFWREGDRLSDDGKLFECIASGDGGETWTEVLNCEVMQFTGLLDKNDKEIYEGDIIKVADDYEEYGQMAGEIRQVYFFDGGFRLKPKEQIGQRGHWLEDTKDFEILGNIHENPELLSL